VVVTLPFLMYIWLSLYAPARMQVCGKWSIDGDSMEILIKSDDTLVERWFKADSNGCLALQMKQSGHSKSTPILRISASFELGGFLQLKGPTEEDSDIMLKILAGIDIKQTEDSESSYVPPFFMYTYVPENPFLLEGSILKNLLLSVSSEDRENGNEPSAEQAWLVAQKCGLDYEYLHAPESFNVGKAGRNIPLSSRQVVWRERGERERVSEKERGQERG
jgi:hypothetical protein